MSLRNASQSGRPSEREPDAEQHYGPGCRGLPSYLSTGRAVGRLPASGRSLSSHTTPRRGGRGLRGDAVDDGESVGADDVQSVCGQQPAHEGQRADAVGEAHADLPLLGPGVAHLDLDVGGGRHGVEQSPDEIDVVRGQLGHDFRPLRSERVFRGVSGEG